MAYRKTQKGIDPNALAEVASNVPPRVAAPSPAFGGAPPALNPTEQALSAAQLRSRNTLEQAQLSTWVQAQTQRQQAQQALSAWSGQAAPLASTPNNFTDAMRVAHDALQTRNYLDAAQNLSSGLALQAPVLQMTPPATTAQMQPRDLMQAWVRQNAPGSPPVGPSSPPVVRQDVGSAWTSTGATPPVQTGLVPLQYFGDHQQIKAKNPELVALVKDLLWEQTKAKSPSDYTAFDSGAAMDPEAMATMIVGRMHANALLSGAAAQPDEQSRMNFLQSQGLQQDHIAAIDNIQQQNAVQELHRPNHPLGDVMGKLKWRNHA